MLASKHTNCFSASMKRCIKRGYDIELLKNIMRLLANEQALPARCRPHKLSGDFIDFWERHIKPDWLLIYRYDYEQQQIIFEDTGTHADLF